MFSLSSIKSAVQNVFQNSKSLIANLAPKPASTYQTAGARKTPLQQIENRKPAPQQAFVGLEAHPAVKAVLGGIEAIQKALQPRFDAGDLYGLSGQPQGKDIRQDRIGDCYYVASLGAIADQQPKLIQDAIHYNSKNGNFTVTLHEPYDKNGWLPDLLPGGGEGLREKKVEVTQSEILDNIKRGGGSTVDNNPSKDAPIWPAVMETAYAKIHDKKPSDGLNQGYQKITGGWARNAMQAIMGNAAKEVRVKVKDGESFGDALNRTYDTVKKALDKKQPVTLSTDPESYGIAHMIKGALGKVPLQDGLVDNHVYSVKGIYKNSSGEIMVSVRNPWAMNLGVGENQDTANPVIQVALSNLVESGGLDAFTVGAAPQ